MSISPLSLDESPSCCRTNDGLFFLRLFFLFQSFFFGFCFCALYTSLLFFEFAHCSDTFSDFFTGHSGRQFVASLDLVLFHITSPYAAIEDEELLDDEEELLEDDEDEEDQEELLDENDEDDEDEEEKLLDEDELLDE